jgi:hypothetical protein
MILTGNFVDNFMLKKVTFLNFGSTFELKLDLNY